MSAYMTPPIANWNDYLDDIKVKNPILWKFEKNLEEAKRYLTRCIKEGGIDESDLEDKSDKELIKMANDLKDMADYLAENAKEAMEEMTWD